MTILDILASKNINDPQEIDELNAKMQNTGVDPYTLLAEKDISEDIVQQAVSEYYAVPRMSIEPDGILPQVFSNLPEDSARHYQMFPVRIGIDDVMEIAMVDPGDISARNVLEFIFSPKNIHYYISAAKKSAFDKVIAQYGNYTDSIASVDPDVAKASNGISTGDNDQVDSLEDLLNNTEHKADSHKKEGSDEEKIVESAPITKMVASILLKAIEDGASDIHIERTELNSRVRYRVDGELKMALMLPRDVHGAIVARIKILTKLKLDEKRKPQDGRFPVKVKGRSVDFRVSTMPTFFGEKVVIRILDPESGVGKIADTGMSDDHFATIKRALDKPYGIILITGPTGSGKSTTLYSMLGEVDKESENVVSLEDPVEYNIEGVSQSQVMPEIGYTFSAGLRSILRQDPDTILVGEIRDKETAQLAIQAALTGHMVLSTLHTNSAIGVVPRLIDMGVDPYLIAPTLSLAVAQRLVRRIAPGCAKAIPIEDSYRKMIQDQFHDFPKEHLAKLNFQGQFFKAEGNDEYPTGQKGRVACFEMFEIDKELERVILNTPNEQDMYKVARANGMVTMREDAMLKSMQGLVSFQDIHTL